jgi:hypothetical protein
MEALAPTVHSSVISPYLKETQEESGGQKPRVALDEALHDGGETKEKHA